MNKIYTSSGLTFLESIVYPEIFIAENSFTFIIGRSGCGKSSYLKLLNRSKKYEDGEIFFEGKNILDYDVLSYRRKVVLVPQSVYLINGTILENFEFYYKNRGQELPKLEDIKKYLSLCCIDIEVDTICENMSGGERQRVFLAIFISFTDNTLLLDEPTASLDEKTSNEFMKNLKKYCTEKKITVVCVCHNKSLVDKFADNIIDMEEKING